MHRDTIECFDGGNSWYVEQLLARGASTEVHEVRHPKGWSAVRKALHAHEHAAAFAAELAYTEDAVRAGAPVVLGKGVTSDGAPFFVLERIEGSALAVHVSSRGGRFDLLTTFVLIERLLRALDLLHNIGIVHRDLDADNVFLTSGGAVRILDYGEALRRSEADARTDLCAAGELMRKLLGGDVPGALDHLPRAVVRFIECATAPDPSRRFVTAASMRRAIELLHREHNGVGTLPPAKPRKTMPVRRAPAALLPRRW